MIDDEATRHLDSTGAIGYELARVSHQHDGNPSPGMYVPEQVHVAPLCGKFDAAIVTGPGGLSSQWAVLARIVSGLLGGGFGTLRAPRSVAMPMGASNLDAIMDEGTLTIGWVGPARLGILIAAFGGAGRVFEWLGTLATWLFSGEWRSGPGGEMIYDLSHHLVLFERL